MLVVEVKLDSLRVSVDFRELDYVPGPHSELELTVRNFSPAALKHVEHMDPDFRRRLAWMVARALKADAFENKFLCKFNLDPGFFGGSRHATCSILPGQGSADSGGYYR